MNDLYAAPAARGAGVADALIDRRVSESDQHGAAKVTCLTRPDNHRAQAVYDQIAARDPWIMYRIDIRNSTPTWP
jgi:ribosomal protein S18 acetylase RimI-like enzyme